MAGDIKLLRQLALCNKEFAITQVTATTAAKFTTGLTYPEGRKKFIVYNNSDTNSGEALWGDENLDPALLNGVPIPVGEWVAIPLAYKNQAGTVQDVYFSSKDGVEIADLRVFEGA